MISRFAAEHSSFDDWRSDQVRYQIISHCNWTVGSEKGRCGGEKKNKKTGESICVSTTWFWAKTGKNAGGFFLPGRRCFLSAWQLDAAVSGKFHPKHTRLRCVCSSKSAFSASLNLGYVRTSPSVTLRRSPALLSARFNNPAVARRSRASPDIEARPRLQRMDGWMDGCLCGGIQRQIRGGKRIWFLSGVSEWNRPHCQITGGWPRRPARSAWRALERRWIAQVPRCHRAEIISYLDGRQEEKFFVMFKKNERIKESAEICRGSTSTPQCSSLGPLLENDYPAGLRTFKSHKANNNRW